MAYSNSSLATYTRISPNRTTPRTHIIDTITIHCVVGQWTAKQICDFFSSSTREASCNYGVGKDGSIGLCVEEKDRSWCSSSALNDHRAVTIEVASDTTHPYKVTDAALAALIELVADICRRNNIKELKWKADKTLMGQVDQQNMTVHRWFANKACPGDYLFNLHGEIARQVNVKLSSGDSGTVTADGYDMTIWNYFMDKIGNEYGVAGLMGNLYAESGLKPDNLQNSFETSLGHTDESYTAAVDDGTYSEDSFVNDQAGYGLAQWTYFTRKQALYNLYEVGNYSSIGCIELAMDYLWYELEHVFPSVLNELQFAATLRTASDVVLHDFEAPADQSESVEEKREEYSRYYYNKFATGSGQTDDDYTQGIGRLSRLLLFAVATDH